MPNKKTNQKLRRVQSGARLPQYLKDLLHLEASKVNRSYTNLVEYTLIQYLKRKGYNTEPPTITDKEP